MGSKAPIWTRFVRRSAASSGTILRLSQPEFEDRPRDRDHRARRVRLPRALLVDGLRSASPRPRSSDGVVRVYPGYRAGTIDKDYDDSVADVIRFDPESPGRWPGSHRHRMDTEPRPSPFSETIMYPIPPSTPGASGEERSERRACEWVCARERRT